MVSYNPALPEFPFAESSSARPSHHAERVVALSWEQEQIWLHAMLAAELPLYNETVAIQHRGKLDVATLESSLCELRQRHEILRTTIEEHNGSPFQHVHAAMPVKVEFADFSAFADSEKLRHTGSLVTEFAQRTFDLARGPLFRVLAVQYGEQDARIYLTLHHLIFDGDSLRRILLPELIAIYNATLSGEKACLPAHAFHYADYAELQRSKPVAPREAGLSYWRTKLAEFSPLTLPVDRPRGPQTSFRGAMHVFALEQSVSDSIREFARRERTTIFNVFLAGFVALLARYTDSTDIALGTTYGGRSDMALENVPGCFLNTLLLRAGLEGEPSFREVLARVREVTLEALDYADIPFQQVVRECLRKGNLGEAPIPVLFSFQPPPPELPEGWDLDVFGAPNGTAKFDLHLEIEELHGGFRGRLQYNTDLFDTATIARAEQHLTRLLKAAVREPQCSLWQLPLLSAGETEWLIGELNQSERDFPQACVHELFAETAAATPNRIAARYGERSLTYGQLDRLSASLARQLVADGFGAGTTIGLMVERSLEMLVSLLAILRAGATYVPMDPKYPPARLEHMLRASGARLLLTQASLESSLPAADLRRLDVFECLAACSDEANDAALPRVPLSTLAYIIFTSGSTGIPKGVEIPHQALTNLLWSMLQAPGIRSDDVLLAVTSICFDIAALEMFLPLLVGARIEIASSEEAADPERLRARIEQTGATFLQATPVTWRMLVESGWMGAPEIKVLSGGEAMTETLARQLQERSGSVWNLYGPTETTIYSSGAEVPRDFSAVTLGVPAINTTLFVLDSHRSLLPAGVSGELYIGGVGLAAGYRGQPELTQERFPIVSIDNKETRLYRTGDRVKRLRDGSLLFLGRMDRQVKLNGFRIELGEIEQVMNALAGVQDSVAIKMQLPMGEEILVGFLIPKVDAQVDLDEVRSGLAKTLPVYMRPAKLHVLTEAPLTPNGKLDRKRLPEFVKDEETTKTEHPIGATEQTIAGIWCELLQLKSVGRRESFFELGGHSLLAARFVSRASRAFGRTLTLASFVQAPTVAQFAPVVEGKSAPATHLAKQGSARKQLLWMGADPWLVRLARHLGNEVSMYTFTLDAANFSTVETCTIEAMATRLIARIREVQREGPYVVGSYCIHGLLAFEVAQQLQRAGDEVALVVLADLYGPGRDKQWTRMNRFMIRTRQEIFHLSMLIRWPLEEWTPYIRRRWQQMLDRRRFLGPNPAPPRDLQEALEVAESQYRGVPYSGKVLFLESDEGRLFDPTTSASWKELIADLEIFKYPGEHEAVLKEPYLKNAVEEIQKAIDRVLDTETLASL